MLPPTDAPRSAGPIRSRALILLFVLVVLLPGLAGLELTRSGVLSLTSGFALFAALEFTLGGLVFARMVRYAAARDRTLHHAEQTQRSVVANLQHQAASLQGEVTARARELEAANASLRVAAQVNALLALCAQHMPNAVLITDAGGAVLWANLAWEKISGRNSADAVRQPVADYLGTVWSDFAAARGQEILRAGQPAMLETRGRTGNGPPQWLTVAFQPVRGPEHQVVNFIVLIEDFTARRESDLHLQAANERLRHSEEIAIQVSRLAQIGAWELQIENRTLRWEPELFRISEVELGYEPTLAKMTEFFPDEHRELFGQAVEQAIHEGRSFDLECPFETALGRRRWVHVFGRAEFKADQAVRIFGAVQEITARHEAEEAQRKLEIQLFQVQKMETLGTLAGGIAHDFNNLLTGIIGYQDLALDSLAEDHPSRHCLSEARQASVRACELVEQILVFSRQTGGSERVPVDLAQVVEEARRFLRATVPATIQIEVSIAPQCGRVLADPAQLNQVLLNLGSNAAHAMRGGGVLSVALAPVPLSATQAAAHGNLPAGAYVRLTVSDTGHGMNPETQKRIFDPFFTTKSVGEGTGLGLAIVHGIIRAHGGAIEVSSTPGLGTTFFIYLPTAGAEQIQSAPESAPPARGAGEVICVVDDEQLVAQATRLTLDRFGYHTIVFNSSEECLRALRQEPDGCALLLSDQTMPGMTGMELSAKVRSFAPRMPILIMSGYFSKVSPGALEQIGHIALVAKPFTADEIARKVHQALHPQPAPPPEGQPAAAGA